MTRKQRYVVAGYIPQQSIEWSVVAPTDRVAVEQFLAKHPHCVAETVVVAGDDTQVGRDVVGSCDQTGAVILEGDSFLDLPQKRLVLTVQVDEETFQSQITSRDEDDEDDDGSEAVS